MVKRIFTLNFLDAFIAGITTVIVPLIMLERGIGIATIGIVFSLAPIAKMIVRVGSAALADTYGEKKFYLLNAASNFLQSVVYYFSFSGLWFVLAKSIDGARESFMWAVNRSSVLSAAPGRKHFVLGSMISGRLVYFAAGSLAVSLLFPLGGFGILFALCAGVGIAMAAVSLGVKNTPHHEREKVRLSDLAFSGRTRRFYETAGALTLGSTFYMVVMYFLVPIFLSLDGFSLWQIGLIYAAYFLIQGGVLSYLSHSKAKSRSTAIMGSLVFFVALVGMSFGGKELTPYFFLFMAIGDASLGLLWEEINYLQAKDSRKRATDMALLVAPSSITVFLASGISGFVVESFGFAPLFLACAATQMLFGAWSVRLTDGKI